MNKHVVMAALEVAALFGTPLAAIAGGWALRRKFREQEPRYAYHAGTVLVGGGGALLLAICALVLMMKHW